ncbi:MAG: NDP-sugar synthase [Candidatus Bathyarchaeia archaeon]|nr:NDP-sugar synthase [Candidatus Bathyarchaeia archaeon]MDI6904193.1 NDP-sugar synthase [Candidatus Bathyarchaeia archaeon]
MKALILAGGFGTRLRPLSCTRPKILFPIVNKPLLQWTLERLAGNKIKEAILAVNYQSEVFLKRYRISKCGVNITYSRDPLKKPLGTGGPIKRAEKLIGYDAPFLVLNGDIFADVNYTELLNMHEEKNAAATIALHRVEDPSRYGVAELTKQNRIKRFVEKPSREAAPTNLINAGVYVLSPKIFGYIPKGRTVSLEREVFPKLVEEGKLYGYVFDGLWMDVGKLEDYLKINKILLDLLANQSKYKIEEAKVKKTVAFDRGVSIGKESVIGPYAVLGRNVTVGKNVHIKNSVIFPGTVISDFASINGAVIGENVVIGKRVKIDEECVLGDHVKIKDNVSLAQGVSICPAKKVSESVLTPKCII